MQQYLDPRWQKLLLKEFNQPYFENLSKFIDDERKKFVVFPPERECFTALNLCPFDNIKVVILGQDPYHGENQAHGLSFSVNGEVKIPPSLKNILKELETDTKQLVPNHTGNLTPWAKQGVLLLNATLTVRSGEAGSHQKKGWETFTDSIIETISKKKKNIVFILWGAYAQKKSSLIDASKHCVLQSVHPSPLSAHRGFFGTKPFSTANTYLQQNNIQEIDWQL